MTLPTAEPVARFVAMLDGEEPVPEEVEVDLSTLDAPAFRQGPYFEAYEELLGVLLDRFDAGRFPRRLVVHVRPGHRVTIYDRDGRRSGVNVFRRDGGAAG